MSLYSTTLRLVADTDGKMHCKNCRSVLTRDGSGLWVACPHQWQPIETAPKDGTVILATDGKDPALLARMNGRWWYDDGSEPTYWQPTHWMPLPPLPEVAK